LHPELAADTLARPNGAIVGVGAARKVAAARWKVASNVEVTWVLTLPAAALFGAVFYSFYRFVS